jgi:hypothetical protein
MPSTGRKLELKPKTSMVQTASHAAVYAKELNQSHNFTAKGCKNKYEVESKIFRTGAVVCTAVTLARSTSGW